MSRCTRYVGRTRSPPAIWAYSRRPARRRHPGSATRLKPGAPGAPMRQCISGQANTRSNWRMTMNDSGTGVFGFYSIPVGELLLTCDEGALTGLHMVEPKGKGAPVPQPGWRRDDSAFRVVHEQLRAFFAGE